MGNQSVLRAVLVAACLAAIGSCSASRHQGLTASPHLVTAPAPVPTQRSSSDTAPGPPAATSTIAEAIGPGVDVYAAAGGAGGTQPPRHLTNPNDVGAPLRFLVRSATDQRLLVYLPTRPDGSTGWVLRSQVRLLKDPYSLAISIPEHRLQLYRGGALMETEPIGVGKGITPTPPGTYFLTELLQPDNPDGAYGPYAFGLSAYSPTLTDFGRGNGQIGLHGTNEPGGLGGNVSHGCIRVNNDVITRLARTLPLGTPVVIRQEQ